MKTLLLGLSVAALATAAMAQSTIAGNETPA